MFPLLFSTIITCSQAVSLIDRVTSVAGLSRQQKVEIISEIKRVVPSCPVTIKKDEPKQK